MPSNLQEIKEAIIKRKEEAFKNYLKRLKDKEVLKSTSVLEKYEREQSEFKVKTGTLIDEIVGGGVPEGKSMLLYGEYGSGKTQTCFTSAALCPNKVVYIDTEGSFRATRIKEICDARGLNFEKVANKIDLKEPQNWFEQMLVLFSLPAPTDLGDGEKIDLIICDSISKHFRGIVFLGRENLGIKNGLIREFILTLETIAKMHKAALIYTTQIYDSVSGSPMAGPVQTQKAVGGRSAEHQPDFVLHFRKGRGNIRVARMVDSSWNPLAERSFVINNKGIDKIPESAKVASTEETRAKKFARTQEQEDIMAKKAKETEKSSEGGDD